MWDSLSRGASEAFQQAEWPTAFSGSTALLRSARRRLPPPNEIPSMELGFRTAPLAAQHINIL